MACCGASMTEDERSALEMEKKMTAAIEKAMLREKKEDSSLLKLLLLGTGESGKSTIFKQISKLYANEEFDAEQRMPYASIVYTNCIVSMKTLCKQAARLADESPELNTKISDDIKNSVDYVLQNLKNDQDVDEEAANHMKRIWNDPGILNAFKHRSRFQLTDSCRHFFNRIDEVGKKGYIPSYDDVLRCRARTTGIVERVFDIDGNIFKMVDVGGQRNERKKWIHCFESVTAVIFVAAINEYDQVLYEDGTTNRIMEALDLFEEICNSRWFRDTAMILFLNKKDLFHEKLVVDKVDLNCLFQEYNGGCDYEVATAFLKDQFLARNDYQDSKTIYWHITCATDTSNVNFTFNAVKDIIIKDRLKECGLLE